jgi:hypothetical protein
MAEEKKRKVSRVAARVGKSPSANVATNLDSSKYRAGGASVKKKKGGIVRKPSGKIRYSSTTKSKD